MQKNLYYRTSFARKNIFIEWFLSLFIAFASPALLLLEVFIRKDFGERYFKLSSVVTVAVILGLLPVVIVKLPFWLYGMAAEDGIYDMGETDAYTPAAPSLMPHYLGWYIFLTLFVAAGIKHKRDMMHNPSVYDFAKFSLYKGKLNPLFYKINIPFIKTTDRVIECLYEPAVFFIAGLFFYLIGQKLGILLMVTSLLYSYSYVAFYRAGDNFVMDKIDEMISNEEIEKAFVDDVDEEDTRGFSFRGRRPTSAEMRRQILPMFTEQDDVLTAK